MALKASSRMEKNLQLIRTGAMTALIKVLPGMVSHFSCISLEAVEAMLVCIISLGRARCKSGGNVSLPV